MDFQNALFVYIIIILSAIAHEYGHAWAAFRQGDPTAKYAGRLTLNPLAHIEWFGTVVLPMLLMYFSGVFFGYAKPVPINPYNFRDQRKGIIWVSLAGVAANFIIALALSVFLRFFPNFSLAPLLGFVVLVNIQLGLFNLLPFPPLDGSKLAVALASNSASLSRWLAWAENPLGIIIAIFAAMTFLPDLSYWVFELLIG